MGQSDGPQEPATRRWLCQAAGCALTREAGRWVIEPAPEGGAAEAAHQMMERGDYEGAAEVLEERLQMQPDDASALFALAEAKCATEEFARAESCLTRLRKLVPEDGRQAARIDVLEGRAKAGRHAFAEAMAAFDAVLTKDADCLEAYVERAKLYEMQAEFQRAAIDWHAYLGRDDASEMAEKIRQGCVVVENRLVRHAGQSPTWSPDGKRIAYVLPRGGSQPCEVRAIDVATGADSSLFVGDGAYKWCLDWSPDSRRIAYGTGDARLYTLTLGGPIAGDNDR